jgi:glycosyltransferase involved in cell wall biosynthesis
MKRVLVVHQYLPPGGFQDRQRGPMYAPLFREAGYDVTFVGRHPIPHLQEAHGRVARALKSTVALKAWGRARDHLVTPLSDARILAIAGRFDVIVLVKVDSPALVRKLRARTQARLVYDLADTIWRDGDGEDEGVLEMLRSVDAITVDNSFGLAFAKRLGPPVHLWPSAAYVEEFDRRRAASRRGKDGRIVLGWLGSHTTVSNLFLALESIEDVSKRHPEVDVRLVGVPPGHEVLRRFERSRVTSLDMYSTAEMVDEVLGMDIGLYPQYDLDDAAMHGTTKGVIYMAGGATVVASPIADVAKLVEPGRTGALARGRDEWTTRIEELVTDASLREKLNAAALAKVRERHSLRACFDSMRPALEGT